MKKLLLFFVLLSDLYAMEESHNAQEVKNTTQLPEKIILYIFAYAMPSLKYKDSIAQKLNNKQPMQMVKITDYPYDYRHIPEEFSDDLRTYKNLSISCRFFRKLLQEKSTVLSMLYLKDQKVTVPKILAQGFYW
jgi:hypothetical protein